MAAVLGQVAARGYTAAELAYAARTLSADPVLDRKLTFERGQITAADFERVIHALRTLRAQITMQLRLEDVNEIVERFPELISVDDFGICGYTAAETPLYRYSFTGAVKDRTPRPMLTDREDTGSERTGAGSTFSMADLVGEKQTTHL